MSKNKILGWRPQQTKSLLKYISDNKSRPLLSLFNEWARQNNRHPYSVRNYYYKLLKQVNYDEKLRESLSFADLSELKIHTKHFGEDETRKILRNILDNSQKISVRAACDKLANGNQQLLIRYQNKYRNAIYHNKELVREVLDELKSQNIPTREPFTVRKSAPRSSKILKMPDKSSAKLKDDDIQALFLGLVRLVKRSAEQEVAQNFAKEAEFQQATLQNTLIEMRRKDFLVEELKEQNMKLKTDLLSTQNNLAKTQANYLSNYLAMQDLIKSEKMQELKNFIHKLNPVNQEHVE